MEWQPIETAPKEKDILMWWTPRTPNKYAEACVIGRIMDREPSGWWNGQRGQMESMDRVTHWMPLPQPPVQP